MRFRQFARTAAPSAALLWLGAAGADAREVRLPQASPKVAFDVPDDWVVTATDTDVEIVSPDKTAFIAAGVVTHDKTSMTHWQQSATRKMKDFGIAFDAPGAATATKPSPAPSTAAIDPPAAGPLISGAPSLGTPEQGPQGRTAFEDKAAAGASLEELTGRAPVTGPKIPFKVANLYGASLKSEPVDVQFIDFRLPGNQAFVMQQESGKTDDRLSAIFNTVRPVK